MRAPPPLSPADRDQPIPRIIADESITVPDVGPDGEPCGRPGMWREVAKSKDEEVAEQLARWKEKEEHPKAVGKTAPKEEMSEGMRAIMEEAERDFAQFVAIARARVEANRARLERCDSALH